MTLLSQRFKAQEESEQRGEMTVRLLLRGFKAPSRSCSLVSWKVRGERGSKGKMMKTASDFAFQVGWFPESGALFENVCAAQIQES